MRLVPVPGVFKPHSDSFMLADQLRHHQQVAGASVLDICTGSGVLAITAALCGAKNATAVDISRRSVIAVRINAKLNGVRVRAIRGSLFAPVQGQLFDVITSNPPYLPSVSDELPDRGSSRAWEAGLRGRQFIDRICIDARRYLRPHGTLLLVHSAICSEHATVEALLSEGFRVQVVARCRGPLGPLVRARAEMLRARGLLSDSDVEEILIFRAALT